MNVLITGITGRIGAQLAHTLVEAGHNVRGLVWANDRSVARLAGLDVDLVEGSLVNADDVRRATAGMEAVYHLGAAFQAGGPFTHDDFFEINVRGTFNMLEAAREQGDRLQHFCFASSDALYRKYVPGGIADPIREDEMPLEPGGMYALTKGMGDQMCRGYFRSQGLPVTIFRFAMTMAGNEILEFRQFRVAHWRAVYANKTGDAAKSVRARLAAADDNALLIARDETGRSYKKHIADVRDIVLGLTCALGNQNAVGEVFQLAAPKPFTWAEAVPYLAEKLGVEYIDVKLADHVPTFYEFDLSKSRRLLGYEPQVDVFAMIDSASHDDG